MVELDSTLQANLYATVSSLAFSTVVSVLGLITIAKEGLPLGHTSTSTEYLILNISLGFYFYDTIIRVIEKSIDKFIVIHHSIATINVL